MEVKLTIAAPLPLALSAGLGGLGYLSVTGPLPAWISPLALLAVFALAHRQASWQNRGLVMASYLFSINLLVTRSLFGLYSIEPAAIATLYALVILYITALSAVATATFPSTLTPSRILLFASSMSLFDRVCSDPNLLHNRAVPFSHGYYLFSPALSGLYAQLGMYGASFVIYAALLLGLWAFYHHRATGVAVFAIGVALAIVLSSALPQPRLEGYLEVNLVQPGIVGDGEHFVTRSEDYLRRELSPQLRGGALNVLPESSLFNYDFDTDHLGLLAHDNLLIGGTIRSQSLVYNSVVLLQKGRVTARYNKIFLVPIEEDARLQAGNERQTNTLRFGDVILGVGICYESSFERIGLKAVHNGAQALLFLSNTQSPPATALQLRSVQVRSAETGRVALFVGMAGNTSMTDAKGKVVWRMPWASSERRAISVPLYSGLTNAAHFSAQLSYILVAVTCATLVSLLWKGLHRKAERDHQGRRDFL